MVKANIQRIENGQNVQLQFYDYDESGFKISAQTTGQIDGNAIQAMNKNFLADHSNMTYYAQVFEEYENASNSPSKAYMMGYDVYAVTSSTNYFITSMDQ